MRHHSFSVQKLQSCFKMPFLNGGEFSNVTSFIEQIFIEDYLAYIILKLGMN